MVKWIKICKTKQKGRLGIKNLRKMNISLLCKWWWRLEKGEGLWQEISGKNYLANSCVALLQKKPSNSPVWNDFLKERDTYMKGRKLIVGKGG